MSLPEKVRERGENLRKLMGSLRRSEPEVGWDQVDDEPIRRFAHVMGGRGTNVHTTDADPDPAYGDDWTRMATFDLESGERTWPTP